MRRGLRGWSAAALAAVAALAVTSAPANAAPATTPAITLNVSGMALMLADGTTRTPTVTTRAGVPVSLAGDKVAANTCYLGGALPSLQPTADPFTEDVYFNGSLTCDLDVVGTPRLWVALQQRFMNSYITEKMEGPVNGNPSVLGVRSANKNCVQISAGRWRGVAHPMVVTDAVIFDWGWIPTYDVSLNC
jgi:hypothetical protein